MRRLTASLLALLLLPAAGCSDGGGSADGGSTAPADWRVERDPDFVVAVPPEWTYERRTSEVGNEFVSLVGPEQVEGYPRSLVVGRTAGVREEDVDGIVDGFRMANADRTFGEEREIDVDGARKAVLVESTRAHGDKEVPVRAWNVFVLTPGSVNLNVEFVAPEAIFDASLFGRILDTLAAVERPASRR